MTPGDKIVISGISGRFPNSNNMQEFSDNLYNKVDMVNDDERRWRHTNINIPKRSGKINNLEKFDATFFGIPNKQAATMDPQGRLTLEHAYEAVLDAGINPRSLRGSRTGVFIGCCFNESEHNIYSLKNSSGGTGLTGNARGMLANRISYTLGLTAPSYTLDSACSSSMYGLDCAFNAIRIGECDSAIVGGSNLLLNPLLTLQFANVGVLSANGSCRPFDKDAAGYARAESVCIVFIQKVKDAKRVYTEVLYSKTNCDGYKEEGITYPSGLMQRQLLEEFYKEIKIDPRTVDFIEAHGTGTFVGDPEECNAIDQVFCTGRDTPLPIGSVKSNMGHSEPVSGVCSIAKIILAFENKKIPPNINFDTVRTDVPALVEGRLKVITEPQDLPGPLIAVNSFGFGGGNAHALLTAYPKEKVNQGIPLDNLPRLVLWCGRTEEAVNYVFDDIMKRPLDAEYVGLLQNIQSGKTPSANVYRGFGLFNQNAIENANCVTRDVQHYSGLKRPIVWVFSGMGSQWTGMGTDLMKIPIFENSINKCHDILLTKGLNLKDILTSTNPTTYDNILHSFVGIAAVQIGLVDILRTLGMEPDHIIGHSVGELGCAYADGCFTAEEMILSSYSRGMASLETKTVFGSMAAIGMGYQKLKSMTPPEIEIACHNSAESCTISGPAADVTKFVKKLSDDGVFAKEVPCSNIPYHSRYISDMGPRLLARLNEIIQNPKKRSSKWLSSSVPKARWESPECQFSSAEYHTNNLLGSVLFEETSALLPENSLTIEIAPHGLLQAILRKSMLGSVHIGLTQRQNKNNSHHLLNAIGKIYENGFNVEISKLYPEVNFPVSRGTPMISPLIKWNHTEDWFVTKFNDGIANKSGERRVLLNLNDLDYAYITGHTIDGRVLFPATAYLHLVWETLAQMNNMMYADFEIEFNEIKFLRATAMQKDQDIELLVIIQKGTGRFEICEGTEAVVTGYCKMGEDSKLINLNVPENEDFIKLPTRDFYKELRLRGYQYSGAFRSIVEGRSDGLMGKIRWDNNWVAFMDCMLQTHIVGKDSRNLFLPVGIQRMIIKPKVHLEMALTLNPEEPNFEVMACPKMRILRCGGIEIRGLQASSVGRRRPPGIPVLESHKFVPHLPTPKFDKVNTAKFCVQLGLENNPTLKVKCVEIDENDDKEPLCSYWAQAAGDLPLVTSEIHYLTTKTLNMGEIVVEDGQLSAHNKCMFIIKSNCLEDNQFLESAVQRMDDAGYVICRESTQFKINHLNQLPTNFKLIAVIPTEDETIFMLKYTKAPVTLTNKFVKIQSNDESYEWLQELDTSIKEGPVLVVAEKEELSGILGLVNCILREPSGNNLKCVFVVDPNAPLFDPLHPFYKSQLELGHSINIFKNSQWGSYRHLALEQHIEVTPYPGHCFANSLTKGDLSAMKWYSGPNNYRYPDATMVKISYASLNFRDVMLATGKLNTEVFGSTRLDQLCVLGFEYSGVTNQGKRILGLALSGALCSYAETIPDLLWNCPESWTLEEAASVPCVYGTVYSALFITIKIEKGKKILIHAGSGGIGLAAIRVSLVNGLEVFTTVSTEEKKKYLLDKFPQLKAENIGNSRDTSFEEMVLTRTNGEGVDYVLNSLAGELLQASIRCLGFRGKFLEIGKFDLVNDTKIGLNNFMKELSFHTVMLDNLMIAPFEEQMVLRKMIQEGIDDGTVLPLKTTVYDANEVEKAFRLLASGKHMGKVLLKIREHEMDNVTLPIRVNPCVYFSTSLSYIIPGGLGGFGLELADWMILKGCRKLVLSSSQGISKTYQAYRISTWKSYGVKVVVSTSDITSRSGCTDLIQTAIKLGPVGGIFNLAVALRDGILENQDITKFKECMAPKAIATKYLDEVSRKLCPSLHLFVIFSSVSCGRGNAGQCNYGMANSVMERIIEQRHALGLPAKAIQWGAVGEVGLVADMMEDKIDIEIGGTLQQRISSCLEVLDIIISNSDPIISSMVVAEKRISGSGAGNIMEAVMNIMSIRDMKSISMDAKLSELGMDSLMAVELKQMLEREYDLVLTPQDIRSLTFMKLKEYSEKGNSSDSQDTILSTEDLTVIEMMLRNLGDEKTSEKTILRLETKDNSERPKSNILIIPGLEGVAGNVWRTIGNSINLPAYILQLMSTQDCNTIPEIVNEVIVDIENTLLKNTSKKFCLIGYSFGAFVTLELARRLEAQGMNGNILLIDGAPKMLKKLAVDQITLQYTEESLRLIILTGILKLVFPREKVDIFNLIKEYPTWNQQLDRIYELANEQAIYSREYLDKMSNVLYRRLLMALNFDTENIKPIKSSVILIRPTELSTENIEEDYGMSKYTTGIVTLKYIEGNHMTILEHPKLIEIINELN
ncbi:unnamed protein product [Diamesa serratosioi]